MKLIVGMVGVGVGWGVGNSSGAEGTHFTRKSLSV